MSLYSSVVAWPALHERRAIKHHFLQQYGLPQVIGCVDGTLIPLAWKPVRNGEDYFDRKSNYSLTAAVVCDHRRRIQYVLTGLPGSAHDQRVYGRTRLARNPDEFFARSEYILADSAYTPTKTVVPVLKKPVGRDLNRNETKFNHAMASARVVAEHTIGVLKMRFQSLRGLRVMIQGKRSVGKAVNWMLACVVLHNLLLHEPDDDVVNVDDARDEALLRVEEKDAPEEGRRRRRTLGQRKREQVMAYYHSHQM